MLLIYTLIIFGEVSLQDSGSKNEATKFSNSAQSLISSKVRFIS